MPDLSLVEQLDQAIELIVAGASPATGGDAELEALATIAGTLCNLPSGDFKRRLKTELQRRTSMSTSVSSSATAPTVAGARVDRRSRT